MPVRPSFEPGAKPARRTATGARAASAAGADKTAAEAPGATQDATGTRATSPLQAPVIGGVVKARAATVRGREAPVKEAAPDKEITAACVGGGHPIPVSLRRAMGGAAGHVVLDMADRPGEAAGALAQYPRDVSAAEAGAGDMGGGARGRVLTETVER